MLGKAPLRIRARVTNSLDELAWSAQPSGIFFFTPARAYGLSLRASL